MGKSVFKWNKSAAQITKEAVGGDNVLLFMASEAKKLMYPFVPMDTGNLSFDTVDVYTEHGEGIVHYKAPYAQKMYEGSNLRFSKEKHPLATHHWDQAMLTARRDDLIRAVQAYMNRRKG